MLNVDRFEGDVHQAGWRGAWRASRAAASRRLLEADEGVFLHQALSTPCLEALAEARGDVLTGVSGERWLDFHGNNVHQAGHGHPRIVEAAVEQMRRMAFCPRRFTNGPAVALAEALVARAPAGLRRVLFAPGGSEAVSMALKLARLATGRPGVISFRDSFHGATMDAISVGGERHFREGLEPLMPGVHHVRPPRVPVSHRGSAAEEAERGPGAVEAVLRAHPEVGCLIAEPFRYSFALRAPAGYWAEVRGICDRHGVLLIFDEIPVCLGRTGAWFACEAEGVVPDMLVLGKGLGGGVMPLAALLAREELNVAAGTSLGHFTHEKPPVASAAGLALLEVIESEGLLEKARVDGAWFAEALRGVGRVSAEGLQVAVEVESGERAEALLWHSLCQGLSFKVSGGNVLSLAPPLTVSRAHLARAAEILQMNPGENSL